MWYIYTTEGEHVTIFGKGGVLMKVTLGTHGECVLIKMVLYMSVIVVMIEFKYFVFVYLATT